MDGSIIAVALTLTGILVVLFVLAFFDRAISIVWGVLYLLLARWGDDDTDFDSFKSELSESVCIFAALLVIGFAVYELIKLSAGW